MSTSVRMIYYPREICDVSRYLLEFWETSDNILLTVRRIQLQ